MGKAKQSDLRLSGLGGKPDDREDGARAGAPRPLARLWARWWMRQAGLGPWGRLATRLAGWGVPPYYGRAFLAELNPSGYVAPSAVVVAPDLQLGAHVFVGDRVVLFQRPDGGCIRLQDRVRLHLDTILQTEQGGVIEIGAKTQIHPRCVLSACKGSIRIGCDVQIAASCAFYPYDHGMAAGAPILRQPLQSKGDIVIEDGAWIGARAIVLSGVRIGRGAVVGAGAVVVRDVPPGTIATGVPARVVRSSPERGGYEGRRTVLVRGADGTIWFCNRGTERLYGWRPEETLGQLSHRLFQTVFPMPLERIEAELQRQGHWQGRLIHTRRDGSSVVVSSRWELLGSADRPAPPVLEINEDAEES